MLFKFLRMKKAGVEISLNQCFGMALRRTLRNDVIDAIILNQQSGLGIKLMQIEAHALVGGKILEILKAAVILKEMKIPFVYEKLAAVDLSKGNVHKLIDAFLIIREKYPQLSLDEVITRLYHEDDIICKMKEGSFIPLIDSTMEFMS